MSCVLEECVERGWEEEGGERQEGGEGRQQHFVLGHDSAFVSVFVVVVVWLFVYVAVRRC